MYIRADLGAMLVSSLCVRSTPNLMNRYAGVARISLGLLSMGRAQSYGPEPPEFETALTLLVLGALDI